MISDELRDFEVKFTNLLDEQSNKLAAEISQLRQEMVTTVVEDVEARTKRLLETDRAELVRKILAAMTENIRLSDQIDVMQKKMDQP